MRQIADLESYLLKEERYVEELHSKGYILEHKKTGARIFFCPTTMKIRYSASAFARRRQTVRESPTF